MTGSPTATERTAIRTGYAALHTAKSPNSEIVEQIVFALGSAGLLQSPETGAEMERLRLRVDEVERQYIFDTAALKQRVAGLDDLRVRAIDKNDHLRSRVAELEAELGIGTPWWCSACGRENLRRVCAVCETDRPEPCEQALGGGHRG